MAVPPLLSPFLFTPSPARGLGRTRTHEADIVRTTHDEHHPTDYFSIRKSNGGDEENEGEEDEERSSTAHETECLDLDAAAHLSGSDIRVQLLTAVQRWSETSGSSKLDATLALWKARDARSRLSSTPYLVSLLKGKYREKPLKFLSLGWEDRMLVADVKQACEKAGFILLLGDLERKMHGAVLTGLTPAEIDPWATLNLTGPQRFRDRRPQVLKGHDIGEIWEDSWHLTHVYDTEGHAVTGNSEISEDWILQEDAFKNAQPDREYYQTGHDQWAGDLMTHCFRSAVMIVIPRTQLLRLMDVELGYPEKERTCREKDMYTNLSYLFMNMLRSHDSIYGETFTRICTMIVEHNEQFKKARPTELVSGMLCPILLASAIHLRDSVMCERILDAFRSLDEPTLKVIRHLPAEMPSMALEPSLNQYVATHMDSPRLTLGGKIKVLSYPAPILKDKPPACMFKIVSEVVGRPLDEYILDVKSHAGLRNWALAKFQQCVPTPQGLQSEDREVLHKIFKALLAKTSSSAVEEILPLLRSQSQKVPLLLQLFAVLKKCIQSDRADHCMTLTEIIKRVHPDICSNLDVSKGLDEGYRVYLDTLHHTGRPDLIRELLTAFQQRAIQLDVRYFRRTVIAGFLKIAAGHMPRWSIPHDDPFSEKLFFDTFETYIRRYVEEDQPRPVHWAREDTRRACPFSLCCSSLLVFMSNPSTEYQHLQVKKECRKHWEDILDCLNLDITYETIKESSPHMLKVTKTFTTAAEQERDRAMRTLIARWTLAEHFDDDLLGDLVPLGKHMRFIEVIRLTPEAERDAYVSLVMYPEHWLSDSPKRLFSPKKPDWTEEQKQDLRKKMRFCCLWLNSEAVTDSPARSPSVGDATEDLDWPLESTAIHSDSHSSDDELPALEPLHWPTEPAPTVIVSQGTKRKAEEPAEDNSHAKRLATDAAYRAAWEEARELDATEEF